MLNGVATWGLGVSCNESLAMSFGDTAYEKNKLFCWSLAFVKGVPVLETFLESGLLKPVSGTFLLEWFASKVKNSDYFIWVYLGFFNG